VLAAGPEELLARLRERHLETRYAREYYIPFRMAPDRVRDLEAQIRPLPETPLNRDSRPVAYYFDVALWSSQFHEGYRRAFGALAKTGFGAAAGLAATLGLLAAAGCRLLPGVERRRRAGAGFCTVAMGFASIGMEILLLLGFQAAYGYVYSELALLIAAFMAGVAAGSWLGLRSAGASGGFRLAAVQAAAALVCLAAGTPVASRGWFLSMAFAAGSLGGIEFPLAARLFASGSGRGAGTLYALDLAGSCVGAVLFSVYLIPVYGFLRTGLSMALVCLAAGLTAMLSSLEERPRFSFLRRPAR
jgi:spermidine synthase